MGARRVIGLTGDVGSGKSTVLQWLADRGAATRDADAATHAVLAGDGDAVAAVGRRFGPGVLAGGVVDRAALAAAVFDDPEALRDLEAIVHPAVIRALTTWLAGVSAPVAVVEAVKLVEAGLDRTVVGAVWLVTCAPEVRRERLVARGWSADEAARQTLAGIAAGRFEIHYPKRFTRWLRLLRTLPYPAYFAAVRRFTGA